MSVQFWLKIYQKVQLPEAYIKHENGSTFELLGITEDDVFSMVSTLPSSKAMGYDRISPKLLKDSVYVITSSLTYIFNQSLLTCVFPNDLKVAIVSPIFKSESKLECNNYRPISVLVAKVFEKTDIKSIVNISRNKRLTHSSAGGF